LVLGFFSLVILTGDDLSPKGWTLTRRVRRFPSESVSGFPSLRDVKFLAGVEVLVDGASFMRFAATELKSVLKRVSSFNACTAWKKNENVEKYTFKRTPF